MNWIFVFRIALAAFSIIVFGWMLQNAVHYPNELYLIASFLTNTFGAGAYVYRNSFEQKALQATATVLFVPFLFILFFVAIILISAFPGSGFEAYQE